MGPRLVVNDDRFANGRIMMCTRRGNAIYFANCV